MLAALYFSQSLFVGPTGDDVARSTYHSIARADGIAPAAAFREVSASLAHARGGWFPLADLVTAFWFAAPSVVLVRTLQFALVLADFAIFFFLAKRLLRSAVGGALAVTCTLCATVYEKFHDPILDRTIEMPLLAFLVLSALLVWIAALDRGTGAWPSRVGAIAAYVVAVLFHPAAAFVGFAFLAAWAVHERRAATPWALALAFPALGAACLCTDGGSAIARVTSDIAAGTYARAAWSSAIAALPYVYRSHADLAGDGLTFARDDRFAAVPAARIETWLVCFAAAAVAAFAFRRDARADRRRTAGAVVVGVALWLLSAAQLGPSDLWPNGAPFPAAYPAVELGRFGVGIAAAGLALLAASGAARGAALTAVAVPLLIGVTMYGNQRANLRVVDEELTRARTRALLARAAAVGLFAPAPENARIAIDGRSGLSLEAGPGNARYALFAATGKRYTVVSLRTLRRPGRPSAPTWIYEASGRTAVASLVHWTGSDATHIYADAGRRYAAPVDERSRALNRRRFFGSGRGVVRDSREIDGAIVTTARRTCGPVERSLLFLASEPRLRFGDGFIRFPRNYIPEPLRIPFDAGQIYWSTSPFARSDARLTIVPDACTPSPMRFQARIIATKPLIVLASSAFGSSAVAASTREGTLRLTLPPTRTPIEVRLSTSAPPARLDVTAARYPLLAGLRITMIVGAPEARYLRPDGKR